ncbi:2-Hydroxy-4-oxobutane-1 [Colletotrichum salicis]|uniref:2-Hydroxy-4-oxobutane-1 n=1 Tax=Colletotrichum salicis TaxID=1209931 RepID=A0A135V0Y9_9PEZI|nr:2-Hydroxy-4-oxobutane-1 [Colletotrichum salicis]
MANLIALEEHYVSPLVDTQKGPARLRDMADNSVAMTVFSHSPVHPDADTCKAINNDLHSKIIHHPAEYAAFAVLPMHEPAAAAAAAAELRRCVQDLGFVGTLTGNHLDDGSFFDTPDFYPLWETAQDLDVPFYLYPTFPPEDESKVNFQGPYDLEIAKALGSWGWGWHSRTGLHFLRLFVAGVFDKFPRLRIILGDMGEMLPFMLERIIGVSTRWPAPGGRERKRGLRKVWDENVWITTSGMFSLAPMACLLQETKVEKIMFSVDYPFAGNGAGKEFMD